MTKSYSQDPSAFAVRFWARVKKTRKCWLWTGKKAHHGYGSLIVDGVQTYAHRVVLILSGISIPEGMCACHKCDNTSCVRPGHLFVGTQSDNMRDMWRKKRGRGGGRKGERHHNARLTEKDVRAIRNLRKSGRWTLGALGEEFEVSSKNIEKIVYFKTWANVR